MQTLQSEIEAMTDILIELDMKLTAAKSRYEDLSQKDRTLDRHFKSSFGEFANKSVVDQAYRVFRYGICLLHTQNKSVSNWCNALQTSPQMADAQLADGRNSC